MTLILIFFYKFMVSCLCEKAIKTITTKNSCWKGKMAKKGIAKSGIKCLFQTICLFTTGKRERPVGRIDKKERFFLGEGAWIRGIGLVRPCV